MADPVLQPAPEAFGSDEPLWYNNGRWGLAGYAIPSPGGKFHCLNPEVWEFVTAVGRATFEIMHREERRFIYPLGKQVVWDIWQLVTVSRKRLSDMAVRPNEMEIQAKHFTPAPREFLLYPIPFFGDAVRQPDLRRYCTMALGVLSEAMQHSEADRTKEILAPGFAAHMGLYLWHIMLHVATKYFNYTRADLYDAGTGRPKLDFDLKVEDWQKFDNTRYMVSHELSEERPDMGWIPTENDLRDIRGIPASIAMKFAKRFPTGLNVFTGGIAGAQPTGAVGTLPNTGAFPQVPGPPG